MMATTEVEFSELQRRLVELNLDRLSSLEPPAKRPPSQGSFGDEPLGGLGPKIFQKWSCDNKATLQTAIQGQAYGGKFPIK